MELTPNTPLRARYKFRDPVANFTWDMGLMDRSDALRAHARRRRERPEIRLYILAPSGASGHRWVRVLGV